MFVSSLLRVGEWMLGILLALCGFKNEAVLNSTYVVSMWASTDIK
jgi:hypothetical protein